MTQTRMPAEDNMQSWDELKLSFTRPDQNTLLSSTNSFLERIAMRSPEERMERVN